MNSDEDLLLEFQRGSHDALEELFERYKGPLCGFFRRRLEGKDRAEDLTQEVFLGVIKARERYQPRSLVRSYLYGIALKLLAAERRRQASAPVTLEGQPEPAVARDQEETVLVRQSLGRLESTEREILMLREYEQLSYSEIAEVLRLPVNTVRSRLFRARMALKEQLQAGAPGSGMPASATGNEGMK